MTEPQWVELPNRSRRDINDGPVYAPDGTYACGDPDCWSCWPEGAANTVGYSAGAVCCPDETSARRHRDRATWWQHGRSERRDSDGWIETVHVLAKRRWTS